MAFEIADSLQGRRGHKRSSWRGPSVFLPKRRCVARIPMADAKSITFRPAVPSDAPVVAAIVNGAYRGDATGRGWTSEADFIAGPRIDEAGFLALLAKDASVVLLGLRDGDIVGCVHLEGSEDGVAFLGLLSVRVTEQGSGLGRALVAAAEDYARRELG